MSEENGYYVVFRKTEALGNHQGVMTITSFCDKKSFDGWYTPDIRRFEEVVEEGVTKERAHELAEQTPIECHVLSAFEDARRPDGEIDPYILEMKIATLLCCLPENKIREVVKLVKLAMMTETLKALAVEELKIALSET